MKAEQPGRGRRAKRRHMDERQKLQEEELKNQRRGVIG